MKKHNDDNSKNMNDVGFLTMWEQEWIRTHSSESEEEMFFRDCYKKTYIDVCRKARENKEKNFRYKWIFLLVLIAIPVLSSIIKIVAAACEGKLSEVILQTNWAGYLTGAAVLLMAILAASLVAKWLDIKQYQQTWVRHQEHKHKMEMEMLQYLLKTGDFAGSGDANRIFMEKALKIEDENIAKFVKNMEDREKTLTDIFELAKKSDGDS
ncbi:MAG: DUF4231 domain-containing protein [Lachnospiraceae bacterium]|nr:DUF4231 domain-containing protein [Lachnospiraceae bacterium]